jgi:hypothetical protein
VPASDPLDSGGYFLDRTPILQQNAYSPWNVHHIHMDRMPILDTKDPDELGWLDPHTSLQLSDREREVMDDESEKASALNVMVNVKQSIHSLMVGFAGLRDEKMRAIGLSEPSDGGIYTILLIGGLRLDLASFTVVLDVALVPLSTEKMPTLMPKIQILQNDSPVAQVKTVGHEAVAWKKLLPAYVERCRTWSHKANCEYASHGKIPITVEIKQNPLCTCGQGIGFTSAEWNVPSWKGLLPFATRAAISPLFSVSYIELVAADAKSVHSGMQSAGRGGSKKKKQPSNACWLCWSSGNPTLLTCGKCKKARYCSADCQRQDWQDHKKACRAG